MGRGQAILTLTNSLLSADGQVSVEGPAGNVDEIQCAIVPMPTPSAKRGRF
jgi:hypothetical protein